MSDGSRTARKPWPWPDPAEGPPRPGLRPHRHPLNDSTFGSSASTRWVDYYGNEHEIESVPLDYARNVIDGVPIPLPTRVVLLGSDTRKLRVEAVAQTPGRQVRRQPEGDLLDDRPVRRRRRLGGAGRRERDGVRSRARLAGQRPDDDAPCVRRRRDAGHHRQDRLSSSASVSERRGPANVSRVNLLLTAARAWETRPWQADRDEAGRFHA